MNDKQKKSLRNLAIIEIVFCFLILVATFGVVRHEFFNGEPVNYASWCFSFLIWISVWLAEFKRLNFPEE